MDVKGLAVMLLGFFVGGFFALIASILMDYMPTFLAVVCAVIPMAIVSIGIVQLLDGGDSQ